LYCIHKAARCPKHSRNFLVCDTDKSQRVQENDTEKVITMNLRPAHFVP
jgi:hypothetical protein